MEKKGPEMGIISRFGGRREKIRAIYQDTPMSTDFVEAERSEKLGLKERAILVVVRLLATGEIDLRRFRLLSQRTCQCRKRSRNGFSFSRL